MISGGSAGAASKFSSSSTNKGPIVKAFDGRVRKRRTETIRFRTNFRNVVYSVLKERPGWVETESETDWDFQWAERDWVYDSFDSMHLELWQRMNHFRNGRELCRKDLLAKNMKRYRRQLETKGKAEDASRLDFCPITFSLPTDYAVFVEEFKKPQHAGAVWIMKPIAKSQGKGIFLFNKLSQITQWKTEFRWKTESTASISSTPSSATATSAANTATAATIAAAAATASVSATAASAAPSMEAYVVQKYIANPYLIGGKKFDLRVYCLVTSFSPLTIWVHRSGFTRCTASRYSSDTSEISNAQMHLTNVAVQKTSAAYNADYGGKWELSRLKQYLASKHGFPATNRLFFDIQDIMIQSLLAVQKLMIADVHCFELYGYDIIIDNALKPWLLEVNASPSMTASTAADFDLKYKLLSDLLDLVDMEGRMGGDEILESWGGFDLVWRGDGPVGRTALGPPPMPPTTAPSSSASAASATAAESSASMVGGGGAGGEILPLPASDTPLSTLYMSSSLMGAEFDRRICTSWPSTIAAAAAAAHAAAQPSSTASSSALPVGGAGSATPVPNSHTPSGASAILSASSSSSSSRRRLSAPATGRSSGSSSAASLSAAPSAASTMGIGSSNAPSLGASSAAVSSGKPLPLTRKSSYLKADAELSSLSRIGSNPEASAPLPHSLPISSAPRSLASEPTLSLKSQTVPTTEDSTRLTNSRGGSEGLSRSHVLLSDEGIADDVVAASDDDANYMKDYDGICRVHPPSSGLSPLDAKGDNGRPSASSSIAPSAYATTTGTAAAAAVDDVSSASLHSSHSPLKHTLSVGATDPRQSGRSLNSSQSMFSTAASAGLSSSSSSSSSHSSASTEISKQVSFLLGSQFSVSNSLPPQQQMASTAAAAAAGSSTPASLHPSSNTPGFGLAWLTSPSTTAGGLLAASSSRAPPPSAPSHSSLPIATLQMRLNDKGSLAAAVASNHALSLSTASSAGPTVSSKASSGATSTSAGGGGLRRTSTQSSRKF